MRDVKACPMSSRREAISPFEILCEVTQLIDTNSARNDFHAEKGRLQQLFCFLHPQSFEVLCRSHAGFGFEEMAQT